jgi:hypothetical protein
MIQKGKLWISFNIGCKYELILFGYFRIELYDTLKMFMQEQEIDNIANRSAFYLDYRPYIRQVCQNEQTRAAESNSNRRYILKDQYFSIS